MVVGEMSNFSVPQSFRRRAEKASGDSASSISSNGIKSFVTGMMSPFTACWQPDIGPCVPGCGPDFRSNKFSVKQQKGPAIVSPLVDRMNPPQYDIPTSPVTSKFQAALSPVSSTAGRDDDSVLVADIEKPHSNDVLCGRGGSSNRHLGNMHFRELVAANKKTYVGLTKKQKMLVARKIVEMVHSTDPPGRFLAKDLDSGMWYDIGLPRSLEKTSQALREKNSNDYPVEEGTEVTDVLSEASLPCSPRSDSGVSSPTSVDDEKSTTTKTARGSKNIEAPPLTIPPHLAEVFGPKRYFESHHGLPDYASSRRLEQPHLPHYPPGEFGSPHRDQYAVPPRSMHYDASPRNPHHYRPGAPYGHDHVHHYHRPLYGHPETPPPPDYRDHCDYYPRHHSDLSSRDPYGKASPNRSPPPPPHPGHYRAYPPPPPPSGPPPRPYRHPPPPQPHPHRYPMHNPPHYPHQSPPPMTGPRHLFGPPAPPNSSPYASLQPVPESPRSFKLASSDDGLKAPGNGCVRSKSEVSPERRQEWKRQRSERGIPRRLSSELSLSNAVENSLSLEERLVGRERSGGVIGSRPANLMSPSGVLQGRSRTRDESLNETTPDLSWTEKDSDAATALSGLAALSTAAFLKLDESSS